MLTHTRNTHKLPHGRHVCYCTCTPRKDRSEYARAPYTWARPLVRLRIHLSDRRITDLCARRSLNYSTRARPLYVGTPAYMCNVHGRPVKNLRARAGRGNTPVKRRQTLLPSIYGELLSGSGFPFSLRLLTRDQPFGYRTSDGLSVTSHVYPPSFTSPSIRFAFTRAYPASRPPLPLILLVSEWPGRRWLYHSLGRCEACGGLSLKQQKGLAPCEEFWSL